VLLFLYHHRIPQTLSYSERRSTAVRINPTRVLSGLEEDPVEDGFRRPTAAEAAAYFHTTTKSVQRWLRNRDSIWKGGIVTALNAVTGQLVDEPRAPAVGGPGGPWNCKYLHQPG
jgi:hypothetical protein